MPPWVSLLFTIFSRQALKNKKIFAQNIYTFNTILIYTVFYIHYQYNINTILISSSYRAGSTDNTLSIFGLNSVK